MSESFFEDLNDAFPINSQVRCGQSAFRLGFAHIRWMIRNSFSLHICSAAKRAASCRGFR